MKTIIRTTILFCGILLSSFPAMAGGLAWRDHKAPFDFLFSNHLDTHQQTQMLPDGTLLGYLYISFTGETNSDGIPYAEHKNCYQEGVSCSVGWEIRGLPGTATFVTHNSGEHPLWAVARSDIPMPGGYTHFHWLGMPEHAKDISYGDDPVAGYFLQLTAKDTFIFKHGGEKILVVNGMDNSTHINIISAGIDLQGLL